MRNLIPILTLLLLQACDTQSQIHANDIEGFDWTQKKVVVLQHELNEISGIVYDKKHNSFLAINDEQGILFVLDPNDYSIEKKLKFGKKGDYECVSLNEDTVYVLKSNGDIYSVRYNGDSLSETNVFPYQGPTTEFESSLWDNANKMLYIISKKSTADKEIKANNMYAFDPANGQYLPDNNFKISWEILNNKGAEIKSFHPSAAALQANTGKIFVVSSIEKMLVILDSSWAPISVHHLDEKVFRQPEGIAFDKDGNLLITNEAADAKPTLVFIPIKK